MASAAIALSIFALLALTACATPAYTMSEEERCARFGGAYLAGSCHSLDDGK